jgi:hypothetical protein
VDGLAEAVCDTLAQLASPESGRKGLKMMENRPEELLGQNRFTLLARVRESIATR